MTHDMLSEDNLDGKEIRILTDDEMVKPMLAEILYAVYHDNYFKIQKATTIVVLDATDAMADATYIGIVSALEKVNNP